MGECCPGFTIDVTVGDVSVELHGHALLTPELLDTFLARMSMRATGAQAALDRHREVTRQRDEANEN